MIRRRSIIVASLLGMAGASGLAGAQPILDDGDGPWTFGNGEDRFRAVPVARDLVHPWSLAFLPNGDLLVAEQNGNLRIVRDGALDPEPLWTSNVSGGDALKSVAVHPDFESNRLVYLAHGKEDGELSTLAISRGRLAGSALDDVEEIFAANAWESGGNLAGRILFGPDSTLYITIGDRDRFCCQPNDDPSLRLKAQSLDNHIGKTLRIRDDGGVPDDNPFVGRSDALPEISPTVTATVMA